MAEHQCNRNDEISTLKANVETLKEYTNDDKAWKNRMEDKVDKILWFFLGQSVGVITLVVGSVVVYVVTKR